MCSCSDTERLCQRKWLLGYLPPLQWGATPLADNVMTDKYFYKLTVFTGMRRGAGTRSRVSFILAGDYSDTGVRQLVDETGKKVGNLKQTVILNPFKTERIKVKKEKKFYP